MHPTTTEEVRVILQVYAAGGRLQKLLKFEEDPMEGPTILQQNGEEAVHHLLSSYSIKYQMVITCLLSSNYPFYWPDKLTSQTNSDRWTTSFTPHSAAIVEWRWDSLPSSHLPLPSWQTADIQMDVSVCWPSVQCSAVQPSKTPNRLHYSQAPIGPDHSTFIPPSCLTTLTLLTIIHKHLLDQTVHPWPTTHTHTPTLGEPCTTTNLAAQTQQLHTKCEQIQHKRTHTHTYIPNISVYNSFPLERHTHHTQTYKHICTSHTPTHTHWSFPPTHVQMHTRAHTHRHTHKYAYRHTCTHT